MIFKVKDSALEYEVSDGTATIVGAGPVEQILTVPDTLDGYPVTQIAKRAFFHCVSLSKISLPGTVKRIDAWAFSMCPNLVMVSIRKESYESVSFEKGVFEGCTRLCDITLGYERPDALSALLAAGVSKLSATYLLNDFEVGKPSWFHKFDINLLSYLRADDYEGLKEHVLCGEEDISYDDVGMIDGELPSVDAGLVTKIRIEKCALAMLRLLNNDCLSLENAAQMEAYLRTRAFGNENSAAWLLLKDNYYGNRQIWTKYMEIVQPESETVSCMLDDLGEENIAFKAFLIEFCAQMKSQDSIFENMCL